MIHHLSSTDSTNLYLRRLIEEGKNLPDMTVVTAFEQTAGRGQKGNSWETEAGKNIVFSLLCHPSFLPPSRQFVLSQCIAIAIADTLSEHIEGITVKWPNDIYWNDKKISGTLIECALQGCTINTCIIGSGVNINQTEFRSDAPNPVSLKQITGKDYDTQLLFEQIINRFTSLYETLRNGGEEVVAKQYMQRLYRRNGYHLYEDKNGRFLAQIHSIEPSGHIVLQTSEGELRNYEFKEVRFVLP